MNGRPDYKPTVVAVCTCGKLSPKGMNTCPECGSKTTPKVRLGADLIDPNSASLRKYYEAGEL